MTTVIITWSLKSSLMNVKASIQITKKEHTVYFPKLEINFPNEIVFILFVQVLRCTPSSLYWGWGGLQRLEPESTVVVIPKQPRAPRMNFILCARGYLPLSEETRRTELMSSLSPRRAPIFWIMNTNNSCWAVLAKRSWQLHEMCPCNCGFKQAGHTGEYSLLWLKLGKEKRSNFNYDNARGKSIISQSSYAISRLPALVESDDPNFGAFN